MTFARSPRAPTEVGGLSVLTLEHWGGLSVTSDFQIVHPISLGPEDIPPESASVTAESVAGASPNIASNRLSVDNSTATYVQSVSEPPFVLVNIFKYGLIEE